MSWLKILSAEQTPLRMIRHCWILFDECHSILFNTILNKRRWTYTDEQFWKFMDFSCASVARASWAKFRASEAHPRRDRLIQQFPWLQENCFSNHFSTRFSTRYSVRFSNRFSNCFSHSRSAHCPSTRHERLLLPIRLMERGKQNWKTSCKEPNVSKLEIRWSSCWSSCWFELLVELLVELKRLNFSSAVHTLHTRICLSH